MRNIIFLIFLTVSISFAQTSEWYNTFYTSGGTPVTTGTFEVVPYLNTYPTGAISMTHLGSGSWKVSAPVGTYKLYYNGTAVTNYAKIFIGEEVLTQIAGNFDANQRIKKAGMGKYLTGKGLTTKDSIIVSFGETFTSPIVTGLINYKPWQVYSARVWADSASFFLNSFGVGDSVRFKFFVNEQ